MARCSAGRGDTPPILTLVELIDEHPQAFAYDWRARFGSSALAVGDPDGITWGEAWQLTRALVADPSSHVAAAVGRWTHPATRESLILADLFDLLHRVHAKTPPKPYPRPWGANAEDVAQTARPTVDQAVVLEALRRRRPIEPTEEGR